MWRTIQETVRNFIDDDCPTMAAALAFYTVFSLPPLLFVVMAVAGFFIGQPAAQSAIERQAASLAGGGAAFRIGAIARSAQEGDWGGSLGVAFSMAGVAFGATTAFAQLQKALNRAWGSESRSGLLGYLGKRLAAFILLIGVAALVIATVVLSTFLWNAESVFGLPARGIEAVTYVVTFGLLYVLFGAIFKFLPDAHVAWTDVRSGALITAVLFMVGKVLLGLYLVHARIASAYGAAGALALILLFAYYASNLLLLGAEFTQAWARSHGRDGNRFHEAPSPRGRIYVLQHQH
jgi:membrane protein